MKQITELEQNMQPKENVGRRNPAFDLLRIVSLIGVIVMHVTSGMVGGEFTATPGYIIKLVYNAPFHYGVPIFVMISGALFLNSRREISIKRLWLHNILRMIVVYCVWSMAYGIADYLEYRGHWKYILWEFVNSRDHLWFMPMIIGLYMIVPILHTWVRNAKRKEIEYFLVLFFVLQIICETVKVLPLPEIAVFAVGLRNIQLVCSYVGYFILGYYIYAIGIRKKYLGIIYCLGGCSAVVSVAAVIGLSYYSKHAVFGIVDSYSLLTFFWVCAVFTGVCRIFDKNSCIEESAKHTEAGGKIVSAVLSELGKDSLGAYLSHIGVMELMMKYGFRADTMPVGIGIPVYVLIVFAASSLLAALLRRIPFVGRYIC